MVIYVTTPKKGENPRERFARSLIGFPLKPQFRYTLRATPLGG